MPILSVANVADHFGVRPRDVSDLFYGRILDTEKCPVVANRRLIPAGYLPEIERILRERGKLCDRAEVTPCS